MSTIREVALSAYGRRLPRGTGAKAQEVLDAVVAREQSIFADIVEKAAEHGVSRDTAHSYLVSLGMHAPVVEEADCSDLDSRLSALESKVTDALAWARSRGYR